MIYSNIQKQRIYKAVISPESNREIMCDWNGYELGRICKRLCKYRPITEAAVTGKRINFGNLQGKQTWQSTILVKFQASI